MTAQPSATSPDLAPSGAAAKSINIMRLAAPALRREDLPEVVPDGEHELRMSPHLARSSLKACQGHAAFFIMNACAVPPYSDDDPSPSARGSKGVWELVPCAAPWPCLGDCTSATIVELINDLAGHGDMSTTIEVAPPSSPALESTNVSKLAGGLRARCPGEVACLVEVLFDFGERVVLVCDVVKTRTWVKTQSFTHSNCVILHLRPRDLALQQSVSLQARVAEVGNPCGLPVERAAHDKRQPLGGPELPQTRGRKKARRSSGTCGGRRSSAATRSKRTAPGQTNAWRGQSKR